MPITRGKQTNQVEQPTQRPQAQPEVQDLVGQEAIPERIQQLAAAPHMLSPRDVQAIQRRLGNRAALGVLGAKSAPLPPIGHMTSRLAVQPKLTVGTLRDKYEQEADQVAEQAITMPASATTLFSLATQRTEWVQRNQDGPGGEDEEEAGMVVEVTPAKKETPFAHTWNGKRYNPQVEGEKIPPGHVYVAKRDFGFWHMTTEAKFGDVFTPTEKSCVDGKHYWGMKKGRSSSNSIVYRVSKRDVVLASDKLAKETLEPRKRAVVSHKTELRQGGHESPLWRDGNVAVTKIKSALLKPGDTVLADLDAAGVSESWDTDWIYAREGLTPPDKGWAPWGYIRPSAMAPGDAQGLEPEPEEGKGGLRQDVETIEGWVEKGVSSADDRMLDRLRTVTKDKQLAEKEGTLTDDMSKAVSKLAIAEGVVWTAAGGLSITGGIFGMASSLKDLVGNKATAYQKVQAVFDLLTSASDTVSGIEAVAGGISQVVAETATNTKVASEAAEASAFCLSYQEMFSTLSSGIKTIKDVVGLVHMAMETKGGKAHGKEEWAKELGKTLTDALQTAKGVVKSVRFLHEALQPTAGDLTTTLTSSLTKVIPGIDIAIDALKSIMQGYYLVKSAVHWHKMNKRKKELEGELTEKGYSKKDVQEARGFYGEREAMIATLDGLIAKNEKRIEKNRDKILKLPIKGSDKQLKSRVKTAQQKIDEITALEQKTEEYKAKKTDLQKEMGKYEAGHMEFTVVSMEGPGHEASSRKAAVNPTRMDLAEVELASELGATNKKRVVRQAIHITTNLVKIAGSIASLVSGPGAPAAIALKATASGVDLSLPIFRWIKQKGRDVAAKNLAKGKTGISNKIFNANKATRAKLEHRKKQAATILIMTAGLNDLLPKTGNPTKQQLALLKASAAQVEGYIKAAGCNPKKLYQANGEPQEQIKILVAEMAKREFE